MRNMRRTRDSLVVRVASVATAVVVAAMLVGCVNTSAVNPGLTLTKAKAATITMEDEILTFVDPEDIVKSQRITESSTLFDCRGGYVWPGGVTIDLVDGVDEGTLIDKIKSHWTNRDGWTVDEDLTEQGRRRLDIKSKDGREALVKVTQVAGQPQFWIRSYSGCFDYPGGMQGNDTY